MKHCFTYTIIFIFFLPTLSLAECIEGDCVNGWGKMFLEKGFEYEGQWKEGKPNGKGAVKTPYWTTISSDKWVEGEIQGHGEETYLNGRKYVGQFKNTLYHGIGTDNYPDGKIISGEFKEGRPWGKIKMILSNGDILEGQFVKGHAEGKGKYLFGDGSSYVGEFHKGHPHGYGIEYSPDGKVVFKGQWNMGQEVFETAKNSGTNDSASQKKAENKKPPLTKE